MTGLGPAIDWVGRVTMLWGGGGVFPFPFGEETVIGFSPPPPPPPSHKTLRHMAKELRKYVHEKKKRNSRDHGQFSFVKVSLFYLTVDRATDATNIEYS